MFHHYSEELAELYLPLALKSQALSDIAITFKGGQLYALFEDSGQTDLPSNFRDILLADEVGKTLQSNNRPTLNKVVGRAAAGTQWGSGLNGGATDVVHMYVNACIDFVVSFKTKSAV